MQSPEAPDISTEPSRRETSRWYQETKLQGILNTDKTPYQMWCKERGVKHAHCPSGCDHPQPFINDGTLVCGCCWHQHDEVIEMIPCTPDVCPDD